jgi:hypothetical protein
MGHGLLRRGAWRPDSAIRVRGCYVFGEIAVHGGLADRYA